MLRPLGNTGSYPLTLDSLCANSPAALALLGSASCPVFSRSPYTHACSTEVQSDSKQSPLPSASPLHTLPKDLTRLSPCSFLHSHSLITFTFCQVTFWMIDIQGMLQLGGPSLPCLSGSFLLKTELYNPLDPFSSGNTCHC